MKNLFFLVLLGNYLFSSAQFFERFADSNFTIDPEWSGNSSHFRIATGKILQLAAPPVTGTSVLTTPSSAIINGSWEFALELYFNPSSSNYLKVYIVSSKSSLNDPLSGYFVKIGGGEDEVSLYYQEGAKEEKLIDGRDRRVDRSPVQLAVRVSRTGGDLWTLEVDSTLSGTYVTEGSAIHNSLLHSACFGIACHYTSTRSDKFFFHRFDVSGTTYTDTLPPLLDGLSVTASNELLLTFSEVVDSLTVVNLQHYLLSENRGNPQQCIYNSTEPRHLRIIFPDTFPGNHPLQLFIFNLSDTAGNRTDTIVASFERKVRKKAAFRDIIINEVLFDTEPSAGLENEYLELYNRSKKAINLAQWSLSDPVTAGIFPETIIEAGEYLIVCEREDSLEYSTFGRTIPLSSFPALNNGSDELWLRDEKGKEIDHLHYQASWHEKSKSAGGWSLEVRDHYNNCQDPLNWGSSKGNKGGTPGKVNSIYTSLNNGTGVEISRVLVVQPQELLLILNKGIDTLTTKLNGKFDLNTTESTINHIFYPSVRHIHAISEKPLSPGSGYSISVTGLTDCYHKITSSSSDFIVPDEAQSGDVIINEILFDPHPGGADFVELYNGSQHYYDLSGWKLASFNEKADSIGNKKPIALEHTLLAPAAYLVITTDSQNIREVYPGSEARTFLQAPMPVYANDEGEVILLNEKNELIDRVDYIASMHFPLITDPEGVSLERVHPGRPASDPSNWHSASESAGFATPGYLNSQYYQGKKQEKNFYVSPEIFSPDNDGREDVTNIHYTLDHPGYVCNMFIYDLKGKQIKTLLNNGSLSSSGIISWDGIDENGEKAPIGIYLLYIHAYHTDGHSIKEKLTVVLAHQIK